MDVSTRPVCPCCRRPLDREAGARELMFLSLAPNSSVARIVIDMLGSAWPRSISAAVLVEQVYAGRPDGEPEFALKSVQVTISRLRRQLRPYGWTINDGRTGGYRLERVG